MSRVSPDPQIQQLRAAKAGAVALSLPTLTIAQLGVVALGVLSPQGAKVVAPDAQESVAAVVALAGASPTMAKMDATTLSTNVQESISMTAVDSLETLSGTPTLSPVIGVVTGTSVI